MSNSALAIISVVPLLRPNALFVLWIFTRPVSLQLTILGQMTVMLMYFQGRCYIVLLYITF